MSSDSEAYKAFVNSEFGKAFIKDLEAFAQDFVNRAINSGDINENFRLIKNSEGVIKTIELIKLKGSKFNKSRSE